jgi:FkbM family methyltransferase
MSDIPWEAVESRYGRIFYIPDDGPIGKAIRQYGESAQIELDFLSAFIGLGSAVVDVGANIGTHALAFAKQVGSRGSVVAFEPQSYVADILKANLTANGCANATVHQAGVGSDVGEMNTGHVNVGGVTLIPPTNDAAGDRVPIISIDSLALEACDLIKIDAEGMKGNVILGMTQTLKRVRPIVYAKCNSIDTGVDILRSYAWAGYGTFLVRTAAFNPTNHMNNQDNFFGVAMETSLLLLPEETMHLLPKSTPVAQVIPFSTIEQLAEALATTPRYGDETHHDRDPAWLRAKLEIARQAAAEARASLQSELRAMCEVVDERAETIKRLEFRCASLSKQLTRAEEALTRSEEALTRSEEAQAKQLTRAEEAQASLDETQAVLRTRDATITALHTSTSWRITAPLRFLTKAARGDRRG